ncbi:hypothetical protein NDU88_003305 [Pleurodeles waltl]|uniref:Uncharacterized protein n=1 Tax=Pleurodeles waltl TaxID=8319 RepID=A0AAV7NG92_PLEWA|nr:hypothetical protein NDU88_003305 [Pleurodeles waltl]
MGATTAPWKYIVVKTTSSGPGAGGRGGKHQLNQSPLLPPSPSLPKPTTHGQRCNPRTTRSTTWHRTLGPGLAGFRLRREQCVPRVASQQPPGTAGRVDRGGNGSSRRATTPTGALDVAPSEVCGRVPGRTLKMQSGRAHYPRAALKSSDYLLHSLA